MAHDIEIRTIPFQFGDDIPPVWNPALPEWSHMVNGASLAMPYLEPFLIKNLREALPQIKDAELCEDIRAFVGQERGRSRGFPDRRGSRRVRRG